MVYTIGVDIGTQGTKAVLIDENGRVLSHCYQGYDVDTPKASWAQQSADIWFDATINTIRGVISESNVSSKNIKGIAISGLYGGSGIPVDKDIKPLSPCLIWMDRRAEDEVKWVKDNINLDELFDITGNYVNSYFGYTKMLWIKNNLPNVWKNTRYFLPPISYVIYRLTNEIVVDYSSAGNIGGVFDINKREWSTFMQDCLGIPNSFFPNRLVECTEVVGGITEEMAEVTGLNVGTCVVCGGVDAAVATLGAGVTNEGNNVAMMGTSMCWGFVTQKPKISKDLVSMPYIVKSKEMIYTFGGAATAGAVLRWFRDTFGEIELLEQEKTSKNAYTLLEQKTLDINPGSNGLIVLPYFMGERSPIWDSNAKGTILGLSLSHSKAHIYKAFMEGVAYALRHNIELVQGEDINLNEEIILVGGGAKSLVWPQIFADVTGRPIKIIKNDVEAPLADALLAGIATGIFENEKIISNWLIFKETIYPNHDNTKLYNQYFAQYKKIYLNLQENMKELHNLS